MPYLASKSIKNPAWEWSQAWHRHAWGTNFKGEWGTKTTIFMCNCCVTYATIFALLHKRQPHMLRNPRINIHVCVFDRYPAWSVKQRKCLHNLRYVWKYCLVMHTVAWFSLWWTVISSDYSCTEQSHCMQFSPRNNFLINGPCVKAFMILHLVCVQ